jgi:hypothetical protein
VISMHVEHAQFPPPDESADRVIVTKNAVIVLDGATAFGSATISGQAYADQLGQHLLDQLIADPEVDLRDALATAIRRTVAAMRLAPGASPSSTVSILREGCHGYDLLTLGDSPILWGTGERQVKFTDDRLAAVGESYRRAYRARLRKGHGFDDTHRDLLRKLQEVQAQRRNREGGYWIAEASPAAALQAITERIPRGAISWAVLTTDGAFNLIDYQGRENWPNIGRCDASQLADKLARLYIWEQSSDPIGEMFPRAKTHDDKTLAAVTFS